MVWYGNKYRGIVVGQDLLMKFFGVGCNLAVWHNITNTKIVYGKIYPNSILSMDISCQFGMVVFTQVKWYGRI